MAGNELRRALISERIRSGVLPRGGRHSVRAGKGEGKDCSCCGKPITDYQIVYEVECTSPGSNVATTLAMHLNCYNEWVLAADSDLVRRAQAGHPSSH
jgi:hypothetical protein